MLVFGHGLWSWSCPGWWWLARARNGQTWHDDGSLAPLGECAELYESLVAVACLMFAWVLLGSCLLGPL